MTESAHSHAPATPEGSRFAKAHHILLYFLGAAALIWLLSGFYQVQTDQVAIIERLGQYLATPQGAVLQVGHGLHYHLPWPIDRVNLISVQQRYTMQVNAFNASPDEYADFKRDLLRRGAQPQVINALFDPYAITADRSVVHVELSVLFSVNDPLAWLESISHDYHPTYQPEVPNDMRNLVFQQIAQRAIISQVAHTPLQQALRVGRADLERGIMKAFQEGLDVPDPSAPAGEKHMSLGFAIQSVSLSVVQVPDAVKPAYEELVQKLAEAQSAVNAADADAQGMTTRAEGEKSTLIADARRYQENVRQAASGEAKRFELVLKQYMEAPDVTRWSLFVDAAKTVSDNAKRIYFVKPGQRTVIILDPPQFDASKAQPPQSGG